MSSDDDRSPDRIPKGNQPAVIEATDAQIAVDAGAGTGKTTTMVWRIEDEIQQRETHPDRILVLTFANEAAYSIKEKLREELPVTDAFDVEVYNYHSFANRLIREYSYYLGLSPEYDIVNEDQRPQIVEAVYDEIDFRFVTPDDPHAGWQSQQTLRAAESFIEEMRREAVQPGAIREFLPPADVILKLDSLVGDLQEMGTNLVGVDANNLFDFDDWQPTRDWAEIGAECEKIARVYSGQSDALTGSDTTEVEEMVAEYLQELSECATSLAERFDRERTDIQLGELWIPEAFFADEVFSYQHGTTSQTPIGRLSEYVAMLKRAAAFTPVYEAYVEVIEERGALDYDELIFKAAELLGDSAVRSDIVDRWDCVFCDEFQDTDESQLKLVEELGDESEVLVIGDEDQAIHEWRGQDPENITNLSALFPDLREIPLQLNFRSRQGILDVTNNIGRAKKSLEAHRSADPPSVLRVDSTDQDVTEQVSTTISHLLADRFDDLAGYEPGDIAVIVRSNRQARNIAARLDAASIPYSLNEGNGKALSSGLRTVISYLYAVADPTDDVSLWRVLMALYRVPESDLRVLSQSGKTLNASLESADALALSEPARVERARKELRSLQTAVKTHSLTEIYRHFRETTRVEWFLKENERQSLGQIEQLISTFSDNPVQSGLTPEFVDYVERQLTLINDGEHSVGDEVTTASEKINIMNVHQAKGLDFPVVLLPHLTEDEFSYRGNHDFSINNYKTLVDGIAGDLLDPLTADLSDDVIAEEWRVLHVAITRAKDRLFVFGEPASEAETNVDLQNRHLPDGIEWSVEGARMRVWEAITEALEEIEDENPERIRDVTDQVNDGVGEDLGQITYYQNNLGTEEAIEQVYGFTEAFNERRLPDEDPVDHGFSDDPLGKEISAELSRQHSHTALEAARECGRRHVLDYVVRAFTDPQERSEDDGSQHVSQIDIGNLFHAVAEQAYWRGYDDKSEWVNASYGLAGSMGLGDAIAATRNCIERYFETDVPTWPEVCAELPIELTDIDGVDGSATGYVDSVRRDDDGELVILDYKTSATRKSLDESYQLLLYLQACEDVFDDPPTRAGYVYVGEAGPAVEIFELDDLESMWEELLDDLRAADTSTFADEDPGEHCRYCMHRSLGCAPDTMSIDGEST